MSAHLAHINEKEARRKWREGQPCTLKELAVALGVSYDTVRMLARLDGFPVMGRRVYRQDFEDWRRVRLQLPARESDRHTPERPPHQDADKCGESSPTHDLLTALPPKAERLFSRGGTRR